MSEKSLWRLPLPAKAWWGIAAAWLALGAAVAWAVGVPYGLFLGSAGVATCAFIRNPLAGMLGLIVVAVAAADWGQAYVLFPDKSYNINLAGLANLVMLALSLLYILRRRPRLGPLAWPFLAFLAAGLISIPFSPSPFAGLRDWSRIAPLAGLYIVTADLVRGSQRRARLWVAAIAASSIWPAVVSAYQFFTNTGYHNVPWINRLLGTLGHPITYGVYLGVIVVLLLFLSQETDAVRARIALVAGIIVSLALLFLTYSRGPAVALTGSLLLLGLAARRHTFAFRGGLAILAMLFLVINIFAGRTDDLRQRETYVRMTPVALATPMSQPTPTPQRTLLPPGEEGRLSEEFLNLLTDGSYDDALQMLSPQVVARIEPGQLESTWLTLSSPLGRSVNCRAFGLREEGGRRFVEVVCGGNSGSREILVLFDENSKIAGMAIDAITERTNGAPRPTPAPTSAQPMMFGVNSLSWRINLWRYAWELASPKPITGLGLGGFPTYSPRLVGYAVTPHNDFVRVFAEMGIVGLGTYLWLWATLTWGLFAMWRSATDRHEALLAAALIAIAACYFVNSLSADLLNYPTMGWVFWSLAALPEALRPRSEA